MCFIAKNQVYVNELSRTLKECPDSEMRLWVLEEERNNIFERLHSSFHDCISPSFFFESTLKLLGEDPIIRNCLIINLYLYENCDKILPRIIGMTELLPFKIHDPLYQSLKKYRSAKEVLNMYLLLEIRARQEDIMNIIGGGYSRNAAVFKLMIDHAVILMKNKQEEKLRTLFIHFVKAWNMFISRSPEAYNQCACVLLDRMVEGIKIEGMFEDDYINKKLHEIESIIFTSNHSRFPFFTNVSFNPPLTKVEEQIVGLRNVIMNLSKLTNPVMTLADLITNYRVEIRGSRASLHSENWYLEKIKSELKKHDKQSVINELGLDSIKAGYKTGDTISKMIVQKKYIYEVLIKEAATT